MCGRRVCPGGTGVLWAGLLFFLGPVAGAFGETSLSAPTRPVEPESRAPVSPAPQVERSPVPGYLALSEVAAAAGLRPAPSAPGRMVLARDPAPRIEFEANSRVIRFNGIRVFLGEAIRTDGGVYRLSRIDYESLIRPLLLPLERSVPARSLRTIVLDPGHGGRDPGARSPALGLLEKDMALDVAFRLRALLTARGYRVVLTREDDSYVSLERRAALANRARADLFISIHFNAAGGPEASGTETFLLTPRHHRSTGQGESRTGDSEAHPGNEYDHWNALLAFYVQRQLLHDLQTFDRGIKRARFSVLREVEAPAVLVEAGYLSNPQEARRIGSVAYRIQLARSLADAIGHFERTLNQAGD